MYNCNKTIIDKIKTWQYIVFKNNILFDIKQKTCSKNQLPVKRRLSTYITAWKSTYNKKKLVFIAHNQISIDHLKYN